MLANNTSLIKSRFVHEYARKDVVVWFHALRLLAIPMSKETSVGVHRLLAEGRSADDLTGGITDQGTERDIIQQLVANRLLVPKNFDEDACFQKDKASLFNGPSIRILVLHLTDSCNMACRYCFIENGKRSGYVNCSMTGDIAIKALRKFSDILTHQRSARDPSIVFYGGEPLLNRKVFEESLLYIRSLKQEGSLPLNTDVVLITNGTVLDQDLADTIREHQVKVSISLDGFEEDHDANRVFKNGTGSFHVVMKNLRLLKEQNVGIGVSCVATKTNVTKLPAIFRWLIHDHAIKAIGVNHSSVVSEEFSFDKAFEEAYAEKVLECQEIVLDKEDVYERRVNRKLNGLIRRKVVKADCTGCGEQIAVAPNGEIGVCQGFMGNRKYFTSHVDEAGWSPHGDSVFQEWARRSPLNMLGCYNCPALCFCGGGCPRNAEAINGSIWGTDSAFCIFALKTLEWAIWRMYDVYRRHAVSE